MKDSVSSKIIFVDKVAGVPVSATVDNYCENVLYQIQSLLPKSDPPLHLASRLDVCTSGISHNRSLKLVCHQLKISFTKLFITPIHLQVPILSPFLFAFAITCPSFAHKPPHFILICVRIYLTHEGIVPLATDEVTAAVLSKVIAERKIEKTYLALCGKKIPLGTVQHCFRRKSKSHENAKPTLLRAYDASLLEQKSSIDGQQGPLKAKDLSQISKNLPKEKKKFGVKKRIELSATVKKENDISDAGNSNFRESKGSSRSGNKPGNVWQLAELEVLSCTALSVRELSKDAVEHLQSHPRASSCGSSSSDSSSSSTGDGAASGLYECEIRLITGRTHQIRLQLAAMGASIIGDTRYNPVEGLLDCSQDEEGAVASTDTPRGRGVREQSQVSKVSSTDSLPASVAVRAVGDGEHLMGPEPKR